MSDAKIKWTLDGEIGATPSVTDMLEACEGILEDEEEMGFYLKGTDRRLDRIPNVRKLLKETEPQGGQE